MASFLPFCGVHVGAGSFFAAARRGYGALSLTYSGEQRGRGQCRLPPYAWLEA